MAQIATALTRSALAALVLSLCAHLASAGPLDEMLADPGRAGRCRDLALREFSLARGVAGYARLYEQLS